MEAGSQLQPLLACETKNNTEEPQSERLTLLAAQSGVPAKDLQEVSVQRNGSSMAIHGSAVSQGDLGVRVGRGMGDKFTASLGHLITRAEFAVEDRI